MCGAKRVDIQSLRIVSIRIRVETGGVEVLGLIRANACGAKGVERLLAMRCAFRSRASGMSHLQRPAHLSVPNSKREPLCSIVSERRELCHEGHELAEETSSPRPRDSCIVVDSFSVC